MGLLHGDSKFPLATDEGGAKDLWDRKRIDKRRQLQCMKHRCFAAWRIRAWDLRLGHLHGGHAHLRNGAGRAVQQAKGRGLLKELSSGRRQGVAAPLPQEKGGLKKLARIGV